MQFTQSELNIIYGLLQDLTSQEVIFRLAPERSRELQDLKRRVFEATQETN